MFQYQVYAIVDGDKQVLGEFKHHADALRFYRHCLAYVEYCEVIHLVSLA